MILNNIRLAWASIKTARFRSLLTMLGIIIGVASVVTTVSLGEGVRREVRSQVDAYGESLITIWPGNVVTRDAQGTVTGYNILGNFNASILTQEDVASVQNAVGVKQVTPLSVINGQVAYEDTTAPHATVAATTSNFADIMQQEFLVGGFLADSDNGRNFAVLGSSVADALFKNNAPIGRSITFRDQQFLIKGVFDTFSSSSLSPGLDLNNTVFIPYATGQALSQDRASVFQIFAVADDADAVDNTKQAIETGLRETRGGQQDFTVLKQEEMLGLTTNVVLLLTTLIGAVAAVALIVGGVGIMNVMLVSVTERTHEIGVRKAVGATNRQILTQFLVEAGMLTVVGSIIGLMVAGVANIFIRLFTDLTPVITLPVVLIAIAAALIIGVLFGVLPAVKAARKDPITALRNGF